MRILHVLNHTMRLNGHVHAAVDLACAQVQLGHDVFLASGGGDFDQILRANGVKLLVIDQRRKPGIAAKAVLQLTKIMREEAIDIAHAHMMTSALLCWPACKLTRTPLVTTVHNEFERSAVAMGVGQRVIGVSEAVTRSMQRRGVSALRLRTVLNGTIGSVRLEGRPEALVKAGSPSILFVGGLHPRKGLPDLLSAFAIVAETAPEAVLHVVGAGPYEAEYRAQAAALPCSSRIVFHGGQLDPRPWFFSADIFVLPSHAEPAGLVLSEASEAGLALIGTNVGGIPEMLDQGKAGTLVPPHSPKALAEVLTRLSTDAAALEDAKVRSRLNASRMSLARVAEQTLAVYRECLPGPPTPNSVSPPAEAMEIR